MKLLTSTKMSEDNRDFWKKLNKNAIISGKIDEAVSFSAVQEVVVKYFKMNNDRYLELIELMGETKNNGNN